MIRYNPNINEGLSTNQVQYRIKNGHVNKNSNDNTLVTVIRDSKTISISKSDIVLDDIIVYKENSIIATDSVIVDGSIIVDEASLNGKMPTLKTVGDMLYTGSKIITGKCISRADRIGNNNYIYKIINITKNKKKKSYIKNILNTMIKYICILVLILGTIMYIHTNSFLKTLMYVYKIIPVELFVLITLLLLISKIKLKRKNVAFKKLKNLETISTIDTICFDKTGTLTTSDIVLDSVIELNKKYNYKDILSGIGKYCNRENKIVNILRKDYNKKTTLTYINEEEYDGYIKINFKNHKYFLGEPKVLDSSINIDDYSGYKVVLLKEKEDIALLLFTYKIKENAKELINDLYKSNINIKIISGDNKEVVINTCKKLGIKRIKSIDMSINNTNMNHQIVEEYNVFYNVSFEQKKILVNALKGNKRNVCYVGDGINDILALNAANSSISIKGNNTDFVIQDDKLNSINNILYDSKIVINKVFNLIQLYLIKTIYSFLLTITLFILNIYSLKLDIIYILVFLILGILIILNNKYKKELNINNIINKSILISLIAYTFTVVVLILYLI